MPLTADRARLRGAAWARQWLSGAVGSISVLALPVTLGLLAFAPLGAAAVKVGVAAAFVSVGLGGAIYAVLGRSAMPAGGPTSATALILASLVAKLAADPALAAGTAQGMLHIVALCGATVALSGLMQVALALLGAGRMARFVPLPVLAGFMNGVAVLILLAQLPLLLGHAPGGATGWQAVAQTQPGALALGLATAALLWAADRRWPRVPVMLVALVAGATAHAMLSRALPDAAWGARIGMLPAELSSTFALLEGLRDAGLALLGTHAATLAGTAAVLAVIGALECTLNNLALEQQGSTRHDPRRELWAVGCANLASGALCGLPVVSVRARRGHPAGRRPRAHGLVRGVGDAGPALPLRQVLAGRAAAAGAGRHHGGHRAEADRQLEQPPAEAMVGRRAFTRSLAEPGRGGTGGHHHGLAGLRCRRAAGPGALGGGLLPAHEPLAGAPALHRCGTTVAPHLPGGGGGAAARAARAGDDL
jgi:SulP family sulfate permease